MKWCRFHLPDGVVRFGIVEGDGVLEVQGSPFQGYERTTKRHALASVRLAVPAMPYNFYAMGANFRKHLDWASKRFGRAIPAPKEADMGYRSPSALIASGEEIVIPADSVGPVQYEGELVAVIGRKAKNLSLDDALSCVLGYTLGNDLSERTWQFADRTFWRGKNADTFKPMGPWIETDLDPADQEVRVRVNGQLASAYNTGDAIHSLAQCISRTSRYVTFHPGDVVWLGCDGACEPDLKAGDVVEIENDAIGTLRNAVVRAPA